MSKAIIREKKLAIAIEKFRKNEATAWKAARLAGVPLSKFMDILVHKGIDFHYGIKELKEDFERAKAFSNSIDKEIKKKKIKFSREEAVKDDLYD